MVYCVTTDAYLSPDVPASGVTPSQSLLHSEIFKETNFFKVVHKLLASQLERGMAAEKKNHDLVFELVAYALRVSATQTTHLIWP